LVRNDLKMGVGKIAAQVGHAGNNKKINKTKLKK
jgi:peptidyl-tRNA hydrolase